MEISFYNVWSHLDVANINKKLSQWYGNFVGNNRSIGNDSSLFEFEHLARARP